MQQNKSKEVFNTIKTITKGIDRSPTSSSIRSSSGELLSNPDEVKQRWFEYGKALYNHQPTIDSSCLHTLQLNFLLTDWLFSKYAECIENVHCTPRLRPDCARCFWCVVARANVTSTDPFFSLGKVANIHHV